MVLSSGIPSSLGGLLDQLGNGGSSGESANERATQRQGNDSWENECDFSAPNYKNNSK